MCDVLDEVENRGFEKGYEIGVKEGQIAVLKLHEELYSLGRSEDFHRAMQDKAYLVRLMREFSIPFFQRQTAGQTDGK